MTTTIEMVVTRAHHYNILSHCVEKRCNFDDRQECTG